MNASQNSVKKKKSKHMSFGSCYMEKGIQIESTYVVSVRFS